MMRNHFRFFLIIVFSIWAQFMLAQGGISGVVQDPGTNEEIPGILVEIQGTDFYDQTNVSGQFEIVLLLYAIHAPNDVGLHHIRLTNFNKRMIEFIIMNIEIE